TEFWIDIKGKQEGTSHEVRWDGSLASQALGARADHHGSGTASTDGKGQAVIISGKNVADVQIQDRVLREAGLVIRHDPKSGPKSETWEVWDKSKDEWTVVEGGIEGVKELLGEKLSDAEWAELKKDCRAREALGSDSRVTPPEQ